MTTVSSQATALDPSQDPALLALIAQQSANAAYGLATDPAPDDAQAPAIQGMSTVLRADTQGAVLMSDAVTPGTDAQVDLQGLSVTDMVKLVFGGVTQANDTDLSDQLAKLNQQTQVSATLGSLKSALEALQSTGGTNVSVAANVLDALQANGVDVSSLRAQASQDALGSVQLSSTQMTALLDSIQSGIDANNSTQQTLIQQVTSTRNIVTEDFQLMSSTQGDVHQSLMEIAKDS
jgi:hypothetical protein